MSSKEAIGFEYVPETAVTADGEKNEIRYVRKRTFRSAVDAGLEYSIVGRTMLKETEESSGRFLTAGDKKYRIDSYGSRQVLGYIPVGGSRYLEYVGAPTLLWPVIGAAAAAVIAAVIGFNAHPAVAVAESSTPVIEDTGAFTPVDTIKAISEETVEPDFEVKVSLPRGDIRFKGTADEPGSDEPYTGSAHLRAVLNVNGAGHVLLDTDTEIENGEITGSSIDYTMLDFELVQGTYDGVMTLTYADGTEIEKTITIRMVPTTGGTMSIGFSGDVGVDLASGKITCLYQADDDSSHDTTVQLVLLNDGKEYVLSQSGTVEPGQQLTSMTLDDSMVSRLVSGIYNGYLRLTFVSGGALSTALTTDVDVTITVQ